MCALCRKELNFGVFSSLTSWSSTKISGFFRRYQQFSLLQENSCWGSTSQGWMCLSCRQTYRLHTVPWRLQRVGRGVWINKKLNKIGEVTAPWGPPALTFLDEDVSFLKFSVLDPYHFDADPDPRICFQDDGSGSGSGYGSGSDLKSNESNFSLLTFFV